MENFLATPLAEIDSNLWNNFPHTVSNNNEYLITVKAPK